MNKESQVLKNKWNSLSNTDKRVVRVYHQMALNDIAERAARFGIKQMNAKTNKNKANFSHQAELYSLAYGMKKKGMPVTGGGKTRKSKRRQTRRRRV